MTKFCFYHIMKGLGAMAADLIELMKDRIRLMKRIFES